MKYAILVYETDSELEARNDPERAEAYWAAYSAFFGAIMEAKVNAGGAALQPPKLTATTVRQREGKTVIQDGPFSETREQLGGMFIIDVPNLDEALRWAERCPSARTGAVEVRPVFEM
jgi:hypothetical protein